MEKDNFNRNFQSETRASAWHNQSADFEGASMAPPTLQLKCDNCDDEAQMKMNPLQMMGQEEEELQMKANPLQMMGQEEEEMQMKQNPLQMQGMEEEELQMKKSPFQLKKANTIQRQTGSGSAMPDGVQSQMEGAFGTSFSDVNIHTNSSSATDVGALAYTQGSDIHFAPGQYNPSSSAGKELIGHELTHVVQQREGRVQPTTQAGGMPVNDDKGLESEADNMGRKAAQWKKKD